MKKLRLYLDTSVIGGIFDEEFSFYSKQLFQEIQNGLKTAIISDITLGELEKAPSNVQDVLTKIPSENMEKISMTDEIATLAELYLKNKIITAKFRDDAFHIALATVSLVDVLVSWNFKHIVNLEKIKGFNAINFKEGYPMLEIRSPMEVINNA